jgi:hypothetical protein
VILLRDPDALLFKLEPQLDSMVVCVWFAVAAAWAGRGLPQWCGGPSGSYFDLNLGCKFDYGYTTEVI